MRNVFLAAFVTIAMARSGSAQKNMNLPVDAEITTSNASQVTSFDNTPESVVMYYYASKIRKDSEWEKVCVPPAQRTERMNRALTMYNNWIFSGYRFINKKEFEKDKWWVKINMVLTIDRKKEDGTDEVTVELINGKYLITEVPT